MQPNTSTIDFSALNDPTALAVFATQNSSTFTEKVPSNEVSRIWPQPSYWEQTITDCIEGQLQGRPYHLFRLKYRSSKYGYSYAYVMAITLPRLFPQLSFQNSAYTGTSPITRKAYDRKQALSSEDITAYAPNAYRNAVASFLSMPAASAALRELLQQCDMEVFDDTLLLYWDITAGYNKVKSWIKEDYERAYTTGITFIDTVLPAMETSLPQVNAVQNESRSEPDYHLSYDPAMKALLYLFIAVVGFFIAALVYVAVASRL